MKYSSKTIDFIINLKYFIVCYYKINDTNVINVSNKMIQTVNIKGNEKYFDPINLKYEVIFKIQTMNFEIKQVHIFNFLTNIYFICNNNVCNC